MIGMNTVPSFSRPADGGVMFRPGPSESVHGFGQWKDFVNNNFPWLEHRNYSGGLFEAEVSAFKFGDGALTMINADASEVIRTRHLADRSEAGYIKLVWQLSGDIQLEQDNRRCHITSGQTTVCDSTRPYRIRVSDNAHFAVLMLPHVACPGWERISQKLCGQQLGDSATLRATFGALMAVSGAGLGGKDGVGETVLHAVQSMITSSLHQAASEPGVSNLNNVRQHDRLSRAQQHILAHISDPGLDPDDLASALCMSRRSLYMLFKECQLTPSKMIHDLRLERSRQALDDVSRPNRKITGIAFDHGFSDCATFSRLFKVQYGLTPSEYRQRALSPRLSS